MQWLAGQHLRQYQLLKQLGANGNRRTWLCADTTSSQLCVLKSLYFAPADCIWPEQRSFEREAATLKSVRCSGAPQYVDSFWQEESEGFYFCLILEYVPGESLAEIVRREGPLPFERVRAVATEVLALLSVLHTYAPPVIHRDLKPANLIVREGDGRIFLVDFAGARVDRVTGRTITVVGSYGYTAPEQFAGESTPASDLYALGATLLHLATGEDPASWPRQGLQILLDDRLWEEPFWCFWLSKMLEPEVSRRFASASESLKALQQPETFLPLLPATSSRLQSSFKQKQFQVDIPSVLMMKSDKERSKFQMSVAAISLLYAGALVLIIRQALFTPQEILDRLPVPWQIFLIVITGCFILFPVDPLLGYLCRKTLVFERKETSLIYSWSKLFQFRIKLRQPYEVFVEEQGDLFCVGLVYKNGWRTRLGQFLTEEEAEQLNALFRAPFFNR